MQQQKQTIVLDKPGLERALDELAERVAAGRQPELPLALVGIRTRGVTLARRLAERLRDRYAIEAPVGAVDITLYRDDLTQVGHAAVLRGTEVPFAVDGKEIVLVDDVLFTGRTVRAAMDALCDLGRPAAIRLAVVIDRGHRELPIQPDYCALRIETERDERVEVRLAEVDGEEAVVRERGGQAAKPTAGGSS